MILFPLPFGHSLISVKSALNQLLSDFSLSGDLYINSFVAFSVAIPNFPHYIILSIP